MVVEAGAAGLGLALFKVLLRMHDNADLADGLTDIGSGTSGLWSAYDRRRLRNDIDSAASKIDERLDRIIASEYSGLDLGSRRAAVFAVTLTLDKSGTSVQSMISQDLDPARVHDRISSSRIAALRRRELGDDGAQQLFDLLLREATSLLVTLAQRYPDFGPLAFARLLQQTESLSTSVEQVLQRAEQLYVSHRSASERYDFGRASYFNAVEARYGQVEIFGIDLLPFCQNYSLSASFVPLRVESVEAPETRNVGGPGATVSAERFLLSGDNIMLTGDAGSGKTTLMQWLAVSLVTGTLPTSAAVVPNQIPFFVRLRSYPEGNFPEPADFVVDTSLAVKSVLADAWVADILRDGRGVVILDGLDELRPSSIDKFLSWLRDLQAVFPGNRWIITSRPNALASMDIELADFRRGDLLPLTLGQTSQLISRWHEAVSHIAPSEQVRIDLQRHEIVLQKQVTSNAGLRDLATSPLLAALICALNVRKSGDIPSQRHKLYDNAIAMLIGPRDKQRGVQIAGLDPETRMVLLSDLALWMLDNSESEVARGRARNRIARTLKGLEGVEFKAGHSLRDLIERTGILREPILGSVDFVHRTFQEHLAAKALLDEDRVGSIIDHWSDPTWHEVIVLACGQAGKKTRERIVGRILDEAGRERSFLDDETGSRSRDRGYLLALSCLRTSQQQDRALRLRAVDAVDKLVPPEDSTAALSLGDVGDIVIPHLQKFLEDGSGTLDEQGACIQAMLAVSSETALQAIGNLPARIRSRHLQRLVEGWSSFEPNRYAEVVFEDLAGQARAEVRITDASLLDQLEKLPSSVVVHLVLSGQDWRVPPPSSAEKIEGLALGGGVVRLRELADLHNLRELVLEGSARGSSEEFDTPGRWARLERLSLTMDGRRGVKCSVDLGIFARCPVSVLSISGDSESFENLKALADLPLSSLAISGTSLVYCLMDLDFDSLRDVTITGYMEADLRSLSLCRHAERVTLHDAYDLTSLSGIEAWDRVVWLAAFGAYRLESASAATSSSTLREIRLDRSHPYDLSELAQSGIDLIIANEFVELGAGNANIERIHTSSMALEAALLELRYGDSTEFRYGLSRLDTPSWDGAGEQGSDPLGLGDGLESVTFDDWDDGEVDFEDEDDEF